IAGKINGNIIKEQIAGIASAEINFEFALKKAVNIADAIEKGITINWTVIICCVKDNVFTSKPENTHPNHNGLKDINGITINAEPIENK
ncbi:hypothetical protein P9369_22125, partial [Escherichia coli]|uniref:hypothetical protein n=1 Tax=Escherichia coli TaxID=562 RepID=UPI00389191AF